jgi:hypothetical protein
MIFQNYIAGYRFTMKWKNSMFHGSLGSDDEEEIDNKPLDLWYTIELCFDDEIAQQ